MPWARCFTEYVNTCCCATTDISPHPSHVRFSSIFYPDSRHPEGRSCTPFRRTISAYLKSIPDSVRYMYVTCARNIRVRTASTCECVHARTHTYSYPQYTHTRVYCGKTRMQKLAGTSPELYTHTHSYICMYVHAYARTQVHASIYYRNL